MSRELAIAFGVVAFAIGVACSSSDSSSSSSSGGGASSSGTATGTAFHLCPAANTPAACTSSDVDAYNNCIASKCDPQFQQCYGAGYKAGSFRGACATTIACQQKCACADSQCIAACAVPAACSTCEAAFSTCQSGCEVPACYTATDAGLVSSSSSSGSPGPHSCAQLATCCGKISDASEQAHCNQIALSDAGSDSTCDLAYDSFAAQAEGGCD